MLGEWKESRDYSGLYTQPSFCLVVGSWNDKKRSPDLSFCRVPKVITNQGVKIWKFCRLNDGQGVQGTESIREWPWNSFSVRSMSESVKTITWTDKSEYIWKRKMVSQLKKTVLHDCRAKASLIYYLRDSLSVINCRTGKRTYESNISSFIF